jgi:hypothetical protein
MTHVRMLAAISGASLLTPCAAMAEPITMICRGQKHYFKDDVHSPWERLAVLDLRARTFTLSTDSHVRQA